MSGLALYAWARRQNLPSFSGQVVVIACGSRGLGLELARRWCRDGASIAICGRTASEINRAVKELSELGDVLEDLCGHPFVGPAGRLLVPA